MKTNNVSRAPGQIWLTALSIFSVSALYAAVVMGLVVKLSKAEFRNSLNWGGFETLIMGQVSGHRSWQKQTTSNETPEYP